MTNPENNPCIQTVICIVIAIKSFVHWPTETTFYENFMQIRSEVFLREVANRQTDRQTNNDDDITFLCEVITCTSFRTDNHATDASTSSLIYYINGRRLSVTEVHALYGALSCGWLGVVCAWRDTLRWEVRVAGWAWWCMVSSWAVRIDWGLSSYCLHAGCAS